jgi:hypothetical protein
MLNVASLILLLGGVLGTYISISIYLGMTEVMPTVE